MGTTARVSRGEPSRSRLLSICACFRLEHCAAQRRCRAGDLAPPYIIGTRCRDRTAARGGPAVWSIGVVAGGGPRDPTGWAATRGAPPLPARPSKQLIKRSFLADPPGRGRNPQGG